MQVHFCSFATLNFRSFQNLQKKFLQSTTIERISYKSYHEAFLTPEKTAKIDKRILNEKKGYGYWHWKPFILADMLKNTRKNDIIFYADCQDLVYGSIVKKLLDFDHFLNGRWDCLLLSGSTKHIDFTHPKCFKLMEMDTTMFANRYVLQLEAGVQIYKNNSFVEHLIKEYLYWCSNYEVVADDEEFEKLNKVHRHDQSILTNLKIKYSLMESDSVRSLINLRDFVVCNYIR